MGHPAGSIELVTAPATEPVTVAEAKSHARIETSADDALLSTYITGARQLVEQITGRALITQTWKLTLDNWPGTRVDDWWDGVLDLPISYGESALVEIRKAPFIAISSVATLDESDVSTAWASSNYYVDKRHGFGRLIKKQGATWPVIVGRDFGAIQINFTAGYGADPMQVPIALRQAIRDIVAHWYENREAVGESMGEPPLKTRALLNQYTVVR